MRLPISLVLVAGSAWPAGPAAAGASAMRPFVDRGILAGAVTLAASKDRVLGVESFGYADLAARRPMRPGDIFWIASMSKPVAAAALMMLVDEGKVRLDDPVHKYLPEFRDQWVAVEQDKEHMLLRKPAHAPTVRNLLSHTSGMTRRSGVEHPFWDALPLATAARSYAMTPLAFEPGTRYEYSNGGINTAGRIVEIVSGTPYERFLQTRLFGPLGMKDTTFVPDRAQVARLAKTYRWNEEKKTPEELRIELLTHPLDDPKRQPMPAGGLFSTAQDMGRFCRMMLGRGVFEGSRLLSSAAVGEMTQVQIGDISRGKGGSDAGYGLGWVVLKRARANGLEAGDYWHGGAYFTGMWLLPGRGLALVLMVQQTGEQERASMTNAFLRAASGK